MMIRCALGGLVIIFLMPGQGSMGIIQVLFVRRQVTAILVLLQLSLQLHHHTPFSVHKISTTGSAGMKGVLQQTTCVRRLQSI